MIEDGIMQYCEITITGILEDFLSKNTGPPGDEYRCYARFRFFLKCP